MRLGLVIIFYSALLTFAKVRVNGDAFIFQALQESLKRNSILLIDVRNRTELNGVGQIPGSVCLPLHEVELGFQLSNEAFLERYGFLKPDPKQSQNIVLTCRSGRRVLVADKILKNKGYPNLRIYSGSFKDWVKNEGEVINGQFDLDYDILGQESILF